MPIWAIPLIQIAGASLASGLVAAGTQLSLGANWKQVIGAFLIGAATGGGLHAAGSPLDKITGTAKLAVPPPKP